jgi:O-antigen/teichoic acid export membrane protein
MRMVTAVRAQVGANPLAIARRLGWGVSDQAVSSLSNFALSLIVARSLGAERFGAFSLAYITYSVILNASRGLSTDPLLVRFSGPESRLWRRAVASATATAAVVGVVTGVACVGVGLLLPSSVRGAFLALGVGLPGLMLQDSWRFAFFAVGQGRKSLANDVVWTVMLVAALGALLKTGHATVVSCTLAFGLTATVAAAFGLLQSRTLPQPRWVRSWVVDHRALGARYLVENVSISGARQIRAFALGALAGLANVGDVRAAEILMGPFLVVLMGISQVAVPEASHVLATQPARLARFCFGLGAVQAIAAAAWGVAMLIVLPLGLGSLLLGPIWRPATHLLPPVLIGMAVACFSTGAAAGLRAMGASPRSMRAQLTASVLYVVGGVGGAVVGHAQGTCWGVAVATTIGAFVWWSQLRKAISERAAQRSVPQAHVVQTGSVL